MSEDLDGRIALVTGAGQGNGAAIAAALAGAGARVVVSDVDAASAAAHAARLRENGFAVLDLQLDVTDPVACATTARMVAAEFGNVSILVNNAGICPRVPVDADGFSIAWQKTIDVNLTGIVNVTRAFLPALRETRGAVINVASIAAFVAIRSTLAYTASKAGVRGLTQAMAQEFAPSGIRVNAIAPGQIRTPMLAPSLADPVRRREIEARILAGRVGEPEELGGPVVFLASASASFINGVTLPVDGGYLAI